MFRKCPCTTNPHAQKLPRASITKTRAHNKEGEANRKERLKLRPTGSASAHAQRIPSKTECRQTKGKHSAMVEEDRDKKSTSAEKLHS
jgi:hypothetical protein